MMHKLLYLKSLSVKRGVYGLMSLVALLLLFSTSKELPVLVTVGELLDKSEEYNGHRVVVIGRVRSIEVQRGRRGGVYVMLVLVEDTSAPSDLPPESVPSVAVVSFTLPPVHQGSRVLVQGVYHREGKQAGRPFEHFIDAEVIQGFSAV